MGVGKADPTGGEQPGAAPASAGIVHRFALNEADLSDNIEAPALALLDSGDIVLAWASVTAPGERQVMLTRSWDGGIVFSEPASVVTTGIHTAVSTMRGREIRRELKTLPHLAAANGTLYLAWVEGGEARESVILKLAESHDGGRTFGAPLAVHQHPEARPTFTSLHVSGNGTVVCSWLDNRNQVQQPYAAVRWPGRTAFDPERMVYAGPEGRGICPCCPTAAFVSGSDIFVTFRANEANYRDMWTARMEAGTTEFAAPVSLVDEPTWEFSGCPHDGPSMSESSHGLHVAWMDAHEGAERVYVGTPGSQSAATAIGRSDAGSAETIMTMQGHPQLVTHDETLHLVWDQSLSAEMSPQSHDSRPDAPRGRDGSGAEGHQHGGKDASAGGRAVCYATSSDGGVTFSVPLMVAPAEGRFQSRPKIQVSASGQVVLAWMELSETGKHLVVMSLPQSPSAKDAALALAGHGRQQGGDHE